METKKVELTEKEIDQIFSALAMYKCYFKEHNMPTVETLLEKFSKLCNG